MAIPLSHVEKMVLDVEFLQSHNFVPIVLEDFAHLQTTDTFFWLKSQEIEHHLLQFQRIAIFGSVDL